MSLPVLVQDVRADAGLGSDDDDDDEEEEHGGGDCHTDCENQRGLWSGLLSPLARLAWSLPWEQPSGPLPEDASSALWKGVETLIPRPGPGGHSPTPPTSL